MKIFKSPWVRILFIVIILGIVFLWLRYLHIDFSNITVDKFKEKIDNLGIGGPVVYIVFYLLRPLILFPAAVLSASAGVIWGLKGFIYLQIAANISSTAEFLIARYFARDAIERFIKGKIGNLDNAIRRHGFLTVLLVRLIPNVAWDIQNMALGLTKVKFRDYFIATMLGIIPGSFALVYFGSSIIKVLTNPGNLWMVVLAIFIFIGVYYMQGYLRKRHGDKIIMREEKE